MLYVTRPANMRHIADEEFARLRKDVDTCLELLTDVERPQSPSKDVFMYHAFLTGRLGV